MNQDNKETFSETIKHKAKRLFMRLMVLVVTLFIAFVLFAYYGSYSTGIRAGQVIKISKKGFLFKTWEGQLDIGSFGAIKSSDNQFTQTFEFSVLDNSIANEIELAASSGKRITLHYEEKYLRLPWRGDTKYFITEVK